MVATTLDISLHKWDLPPPIVSGATNPPLLTSFIKLLISSVILAQTAVGWSSGPHAPILWSSELVYIERSRVNEPFMNHKIPWLESVFVVLKGRANIRRPLTS